VDARLRTGARALVDVELDREVEVELVAVLEALELAERFRPHQLELAAGLQHQAVVLPQRFVVEVVVGFLGEALADAGPTGAVITGAEVPLVVEEVVDLGGELALVAASAAGVALRVAGAVLVLV